MGEIILKCCRKFRIQFPGVSVH